jgi:hypothetical protein
MNPHFTAEFIVPVFKVSDWLADLTDILQKRLKESARVFVAEAEQHVPVYSGALKHSLFAGWGEELNVPMTWGPPNPGAYRFHGGPEGVSEEIMSQWGQSSLIWNNSQFNSEVIIVSSVWYYPIEEYTGKVSPSAPWRSFAEGRMKLVNFLESQKALAPPNIDTYKVRVF